MTSGDIAVMEIAPASRPMLSGRSLRGCSHPFAGQLTGLLHPGGELALIELVILAEIEMAHLLLLGFARRHGIQRRAAKERHFDVAREDMDAEGTSSPHRCRRVANSTSPLVHVSRNGPHDKYIELASERHASIPASPRYRPARERHHTPSRSADCRRQAGAACRPRVSWPPSLRSLPASWVSCPPLCLIQPGLAHCSDLALVDRIISVTRRLSSLPARLRRRIDARSIPLRRSARPDPPAASRPPATGAGDTTDRLSIPGLSLFSRSSSVQMIGFQSGARIMRAFGIGNLDAVAAGLADTERKVCWIAACCRIRSRYAHAVPRKISARAGSLQRLLSRRAW